MKRSSPDSPSSSSGSTTISLPDHEKPRKRSRKNHNQLHCQIKNTTTRSSIYRGVTRHRWTGRFEAHLWDKSSWNNIQNKKGRQVYLGAYDSEEAAAHTYDLAALKYWGSNTTLNFPIETYENELEEMKRVSKEEYLASLRRRSNGFSRGVSKYRGVARHHHNGRWEARIGRVFGNKYLYLGTYNTQEEAAAAYDIAAIEHRGPSAVTNFDISNYAGELKKKGLLPDVAPRDQSCEAESERKPCAGNQEFERKPCADNQETKLEVKAEDQETERASRENQETESPPAQELCRPQLMSPYNVEEDELLWSFCMDAGGGLAPLPLPEIRLEQSGELPDPFVDSGFEDDIAFIFETTNCNGNGEEEEGEEQGKNERLSSSTTLVSCS